MLDDRSRLANTNTNTNTSEKSSKSIDRSRACEWQVNRREESIENYEKSGKEYFIWLIEIREFVRCDNGKWIACRAEEKKVCVSLLIGTGRKFCESLPARLSSRIPHRNGQVSVVSSHVHTKSMFTLFHPETRQHFRWYLLFSSLFCFALSFRWMKIVDATIEKTKTVRYFTWPLNSRLCCARLQCQTIHMINDWQLSQRFRSFTAVRYRILALCVMLLFSRIFSGFCCFAFERFDQLSAIGQCVSVHTIHGIRFWLLFLLVLHRAHFRPEISSRSQTMNNEYTHTHTRYGIWGNRFMWNRLDREHEQRQTSLAQSIGNGSICVPYGVHAIRR